MRCARPSALFKETGIGWNHFFQSTPLYLSGEAHRQLGYEQNALRNFVVRQDLPCVLARRPLSRHVPAASRLPRLVQTSEVFIGQSSNQ